MASIKTNETSNWYPNNPQYEIDATIRFWFLLVPDVLSVICTIFVLYHLLRDRHLRAALHNHTLIIILFLTLAVQLIDIPLSLQFFKTGSVHPAVPSTCLLWWFIDGGIYYTIEVLLVFASIERHILIFHSQLVATKRRRWMFHYLPLLTITSFMMLFYVIAIFTPICESTFDYTSYLCGTQACYTTISLLIGIEQIGFSGTSSCLMGLFNMTLLTRVIRQKYRIHQLVQWKRQRKLGVQMIILSLLYLVFAFPLTVVYLVQLYGSSDWGIQAFPIIYFISYYAVLLFPFISLGNIPDVWKKLKKCNTRQPRRVAAVALRP